MIATTVSSSMSVNPARFMCATDGKRRAAELARVGPRDVWRPRSGVGSSPSGTCSASRVLIAT
jgi:hypothetical protein